MTADLQPPPEFNLDRVAGGNLKKKLNVGNKLFSFFFLLGNVTMNLTLPTADGNTEKGQTCVLKVTVFD